MARNPRYPSSVPASPTWERVALFLFGAAFSLLVVAIAIFFPTPTAFQYTVFRIVLALAAAGIAAFIPGVISLNLGWLRAGGALAVFAVVYLVNPAALLVEQVGGRHITSEQSKKMVADLLPFSGKKIYISSYTGDVEAANLGEEIITVLSKAHITTFNHLSRANAQPGGVEFGIVLCGLPPDTDLAQSIISTLRHSAQLEVRDPMLPAQIKMDEDTTLGIMVGMNRS